MREQNLFCFLRVNRSPYLEKDITVLSSVLDPHTDKHSVILAVPEPDHFVSQSGT
jgi:hypothetical protein